MEKREILSHQKEFRQINYLVTSLVKMFLSRNFFQQRLRVNFQNFHTVHSDVWKNDEFTLTEKNLVKATI